MATGLISRIVHNLRFWGGALSDHAGDQLGVPSTTAERPVSPDRALQLSAVYACVDLIAETIASFPLTVFERDGSGGRTEASDSRLWLLLHDSPNSLMTPFDFWRALLVQLELRGNAYAKLDRNASGEVVAMWALSTDQMTDKVTETGEQIYIYGKDGHQTVFKASDILHLKGIGSTGFHGFAKLDFMASTVREADSMAGFANMLASTANKPAGIVQVSHMTDADQRLKLMKRLSQFKQGDSRFLLIDGDMQFKQVSITPQESQLLETRKWSTEEVCRWFRVPPQLVGGTGSSTWGNGIEQLTLGFEKYTIRPIVCGLEQAIRLRVMTDDQRRKFDAEFSMTNLLRTSLQERFSVYATATQNGLMTRNEVRRQESLEPIPGADELTAQTSLAPLSSLGKTANNGSPSESTEAIKQ
nr:MAG TPA: portal protein [Caudoviricetes sp.]